MPSRISGNALFFAIIISLVIGLLCSALIFISYYRKLQVQQDLTKERLMRNAQSAMAILMATNQEAETVRTIDLYQEGKDSVFMRKTNWGLYQVGHVKAFAGKDTSARTFLLGTIL